MNKEQIIIDDVDVSKCTLYGDGRCNNACNPLNCLFCSEKPNCHFKQLARKTQECEELISEKDFYLQKIAVLEQECEELKEQLQANQPTGICETCMAKAILQNDKYRKALKEIGKIVKINCEEICGRKFEDCNDFLCSSKNILDIINKAKGEE